jgi:protein-tyrosine phosphatase
VETGNCTPVWAGDRAVETRSVENLRDLGGYPAANGRTVRWGRFFRGAALPKNMPPEELRMLSNLHLAQVFDFRTEDEAADAPGPLPEGAVYRAVPAFADRGDAGRLLQMDLTSRIRSVQNRADADIVRRMFTGIYAELPFANSAYRTVLDALDMPDGERHGLPMLLHCTAGKDRTGIGCALILLALGAPREVILEDYMLSQPYREESNRRLLAYFAQLGATEPALELAAEMISVTPALLNRALDAIDARYPDLNAFFAAEYDADARRLARWRALHTV